MMQQNVLCVNTTPGLAYQRSQAPNSLGVLGADGELTSLANILDLAVELIILISMGIHSTYI